MGRIYVRMFVLGVIVALSSFAGKASATDVVDKVIIVVNEEVVTQREYDRAFLPVKQEIENNFKGEELQERLKVAEQGIKDHLINTKLAISIAKKEKIKIDEKELTDRIDKIKAYYGSEQDFLMALNEKGTNFSEFERDIREQMLAQKLVQEKVSASIVVTPGEIRELYEKNLDQLVAPKQAQVRTIMVRKTDDRKDEDSRKKMEEILAEAKKTKDFAALAKEKSEGPYAAEGGDMGYVMPGQTVDEIDGVIFSLNKGQVSDVVETEIGYHIFYIEDMKEPRTLEFAEVNDFLREQLFMRKFQEELVKYLKENREKAYISYK